MCMDVIFIGIMYVQELSTECFYTVHMGLLTGGNITEYNVLKCLCTANSTKPMDFHYINELNSLI